MNKAVTILAALIVVLVFTTIPAAAIDKPVVTLDRVEVAGIQPFFVKPIIGKKDDGSPIEGTHGYSSTLALAYVFDVKNPNKTPLMLDELQFTTSFEGFDVNTVMSYDDVWIPAGKSNHFRVVVLNEAFPTIASLTVGAEHSAKIQAMKTSAGALVKKWWESVGDFSFPIEVTNGTALFQDEKGATVQVTFSDKWPKKK